MLTLLHISDLHFGPHHVPRVAESLLEIASSLEPDVIVASGDFTQRARPEQFADARRYLDRLPKVPLVTTPGNHDVPLYRFMERLFSPLELYREHISEDLNQTLAWNQVVIVSLDSTAPLRAVVNGRIDKPQLDYCEQAFTEASEHEVRIVVAHHHFAPAHDYLPDRTMPGAKRAMDRFEKLKVDLVLGGHLHRAFIGHSLDFYPGADREHGVIVVQCGTTTSRRGRGREKEKNSFNLIRVEDKTIRVTHYMFFDEVPGFAPISTHVFPRRTDYLLE
ncbi:MAG: metallophosphoesterase [Planctomycetales bacterium]